MEDIEGSLTASSSQTLNDHLLEALVEGDLGIVKRLIQGGADFHSRWEVNDNTALMNACFYGYEDVAKFRIKEGALLDLQEYSEGCTAPDTPEEEEELELEVVQSVVEDPEALLPPVMAFIKGSCTSSYILRKALNPPDIFSI